MGIYKQEKTTIGSAVGLPWTDGGAVWVKSGLIIFYGSQAHTWTVLQPGGIEVLRYAVGTLQTHRRHLDTEVLGE